MTGPERHARPAHLVGSENSGIGPTSQQERIEALDVLRGFAILGILTMNVGGFSMPSAAYMDPTAWGELSGLNLGVWVTTHLFADLKFMAIFSMLFGAGLVLMSNRRSARGEKTAGLHLRRMFWLLVFGLLHAHLLWPGDVLVWYALCGTVLFAFRNVEPRTLISLALVSWSIGSLILIAGALSFQYWPPEEAAQFIADLKPHPEVLLAEVNHYRGGWLEQMHVRLPSAIESETTIFTSWAVWRVSGLMLLGMALFKLGILTGQAESRTYRRMISAGLVVGLPLIGLGIQRNFAAAWAAPDFLFINSLLNYWGSIPVALGWVGVVMLTLKSGLALDITSRLSAVGRLAFTNYILQTVICTTIFYGHGLGLFGSIDRSGQLLVVFAVWGFQLWLSPLWLRSFRFGPLEWLWRSLVYVKVQPMRNPSVS